jgi:hypothetical protein
MRYRILLAAAGLLTASASVYGQAKLAGKWQTDNVPAALEAQKNAPAPTEGAAKGGGGRGGGQAIILDLQVDASGKISGMVNEIGNGAPLTIESGMITGKMITFVTQPRGVTWNLEMTDDDTVTLTARIFAARGGAPVVLLRAVAVLRVAAVLRAVVAEGAVVVAAAGHRQRSCSTGRNRRLAAQRRRPYTKP